MRDTIKAIGKDIIEWIVVDHYAIEKTWQKLLRPYTKKIMVIDDLADRYHDCDLLLDQNLVYNFKNRYNNLLPKKVTYYWSSLRFIRYAIFKTA